MLKGKAIRLLKAEIQAAMYPDQLKEWRAEAIALYLWKCGWRKEG